MTIFLSDSIWMLLMMSEVFVKEWAEERSYKLERLADKKEALRQIARLNTGDILVGTFMDLALGDCWDIYELHRLIEFAGDRVPWSAGVLILDYGTEGNVEEINAEMAAHSKVVVLADVPLEAEPILVEIDKIVAALRERKAP